MPGPVSKSAFEHNLIKAYTNLHARNETVKGACRGSRSCDLGEPLFAVGSDHDVLSFIPREAKRPEHTSMTMEEVQKCLAVLEQRERLILKFAILAGLRPGEIFGLKWGRLTGTHADIRQRIYRGEIDSPKTSNSIRKAALKGCSPRLNFGAAFRWTLTPMRGCSLQRPEKLRSVATTSGDGESDRSLETVGLGWVDFHVMRRTHSSLMNELHDDPKLVADQLGHTVDVNQNVYTRASVARRKVAVDAPENALPVN